MITRPMVENSARFPSRAKFILVNDRIPRADAACFMCCCPIGQGYVRDARTRLLFCSSECFAVHETPATLAVGRRTRQASGGVS